MLLISELTTNLLPLLHAQSVATLPVWSQNQITRFITDGLKRLAENFGLFVIRDNISVRLIQSEALYDAPPRHVSTLHIAVNNRGLIADATHHLERRDPDYQTTQAAEGKHVQRWYADKVGVNMIGFQPVPGVEDDAAYADIIYVQFPCIHEGQINVQFTAPLFIGDWAETTVIGEAYGCESDFQMMESSQAGKQLKGLYEEIFASYWRRAQ